MTPATYQSGHFPPDDHLDWRALVPLLGPAITAVVRYDTALARVPNAAVLLAPLALREAVFSSRIEGILASVSDVLGVQAGQKPESDAQEWDIHEVLNYGAAMEHAEAALASLPLSLRVLREVHAILLEGERGKGKAPGELRRIPNWIGRPGASIDEATYVPITADALPAAMSRWESYLHANAPDRLVQLAVLHLEFEAMHPFLDGNGRLGRMLVPLFLWQNGLIRTPAFHISAWIEARRSHYYERLLAVSRDGDWTGWCDFFLQAVRAQAEDSRARVERILTLHGDAKGRLAKLTRSRYAASALDWIFRCPIFRASGFVHDSGIPPSLAWRMLSLLRKAKILETLVPSRGRRSSVLSFPALLDIAERNR